jgi:hypothetical protein
MNGMSPHCWRYIFTLVLDEATSFSVESDGVDGLKGLGGSASVEEVEDVLHCCTRLTRARRTHEGIKVAGRGARIAKAQTADEDEEEVEQPCGYNAYVNAHPLEQ